MKKILLQAYTLVLVLVFSLCLAGCNSTSGQTSSKAPDSARTSVSVSAASSSSSGVSSSSSATSAFSGASSPGSVTENGEYTDKDSVALYIHTYGHLPSNYISKTKARKAGWDNTKGNLWNVLPGKSIGGSEYYNEDGQLPDANGRRWTECDIDYQGGYRGAKRIVFSNDGLIFYTRDHYETFERLY